MKITTIMIASLLVVSVASTCSPEQIVTVNANIRAGLVFDIVTGSEVSLMADPLENVYDNGWTNFAVKTNAPFYSVTVDFGELAIGDYDLIKNGNLLIWSKPSGDGERILRPSPPKNGQYVLAGETGFTNRETFGVGYKLVVDYTVPAGQAETTVVFTASVSL